MKLYLMRHGETDLNRRRVLQGQSDPPLNEVGRAQARAAAVWIRENGLSFDRIYSSPLIRAAETAAIAGGVPQEAVLTDARLIEIDFGPYEMKSYEELDEDMLRFFRDPANTPPPRGMEPLSHVSARTAAFFTALADGPAAESDMKCLLVSHGVAIRAMFGFFLQTARAADKAADDERGWDRIWSIMIGNCDIFEVTLCNGRYGPPKKLRGDRTAAHPDL